MSACRSPTRSSTPGPDGELRLAYDAPVPAEAWNAQVSLLTGMEAARIMLEGGVGLVRTLPPADDRTLARLRRSAQALGVAWPDDGGYPAFVRSLDPATPTGAALLVQASRVLRGAGYAGFRDGDVPADPRHAAVAAPYAHVTAPLRRLCDRAANEVVLALLAGSEVPEWAPAEVEVLPEVMAEATARESAYARAALDLVEALVLRPAVGPPVPGRRGRRRRRAGAGAAPRPRGRRPGAGDPARAPRATRSRSSCGAPTRPPGGSTSRSCDVRAPGDAVAAFLAGCRQAVGEADVVTDPDVTAGYVTDWTRRFTGATPAVVRPGSTAEVAAVVGLARRHRVALVPQGGNTGLVAGGVPLAGEVVVSLTRLAALGPVDRAAGAGDRGRGCHARRARRPRRRGGVGVRGRHRVAGVGDGRRDGRHQRRRAARRPLRRHAGPGGRRRGGAGHG